MSVAGSGVSQMSGAPAARTTSRISAGSIWPDSRPACRSRPDPNSSRELLQCTSATPSTGVSNAVANGDAVYDEAPARKVSDGSTLMKVVAVFLASLF